MLRKGRRLTPPVASGKVRSTVRLCPDSHRELLREAERKRVTRNLMIDEILRERYELPPIPELVPSS